jgi:uncharacterized protein YecE (DUF72 family)
MPPPRPLRLRLGISGWSYKAWVTPAYLELLRRHRAAAVLIDHPYMPPPAEQLALGMVTADFAYIRLLGDRYKIEEITRSWDVTVLDRSDRLDDWTSVIRRLGEMHALPEIYTFSNNHYAGHLPRAGGAPRDSREPVLSSFKRRALRRRLLGEELICLAGRAVLRITAQFRV